MNAFDPGSYGACPEALYCDAAAVAFDPDVYDCARCSHMNGSHCGPNGECSECEPPEPSRLVQAAVWVGVGVCIALCVGRAVWKGVRG